MWHDEVASRAIGAIAASSSARSGAAKCAPAIHGCMHSACIGPMIMGVLWQHTLVPAGGEPFDLPALAAQHADAVLSGLLTGDAA